MSMYGANPEQLAQLGRALRQQIEVVEQVQRTVTQALGGTTRMGPARDRFEHDWNSSFRTVLGRLTQAFDGAGADCLARSEELRRVMGAR